MRLSREFNAWPDLASDQAKYAEIARQRRQQSAAQGARKIPIEHAIQFGGDLPHRRGMKSSPAMKECINASLLDLHHPPIEGRARAPLASHSLGEVSIVLLERRAEAFQ
jgi:hypothetical protein